MYTELIWDGLRTISKALNDELKIAILNILYESGECTEHQIITSIDEDESKIKKSLKELEAISILKRKSMHLHPLEIENVYSLSGKGVRLFSMIKTLAERELRLWIGFEKVWRWENG